MSVLFSYKMTQWHEINIGAEIVFTINTETYLLLTLKLKYFKMKASIQIPKEILAQIDFQNTINGGVSETTVQAWASKEGYKMVVKAPGVNPDTIRVKIVDKRFLVYHSVDVMEKTGQLPYYLVNLPLSPEVDVDHITAHYKNDERIFITAPFNDWAKGQHRDIDLDKIS